MKKLHLDEVKKLFEEEFSLDREKFLSQVEAFQVAVYTMIGGGGLGSLAVRNPANFYIDGRIGRLPYPRREILQAIEVLKIMAEVAGLNPKAMPRMPCFHHAGIF
jgi:hypothetical protein